MLKGLEHIHIAIQLRITLSFFQCFGLANYGNRAVAQCRDNQEDLNETFSNIVTLHIAFSAICCVVYILYVVFLAKEKLYAGIQFAYVIKRPI